MDLKNSFRRLDKLNFKQVVELVKNHPYYIKEENKELFLREIARAGDFFATQDGYKEMFIVAIKKYAEESFLEAKKTTSKLNNNYDSEAKIIIGNIIWKCNIMASAIRFIGAAAKLNGANNELTQVYGEIDIDSLNMLCENCDLFTTPEKEHEFAFKFNDIFKEYQQFLFSKNPDTSEISAYKTKVVQLIDNFFDNNLFLKKIQERTSYQYCDKALLSKYLDMMDRTQLAQLFMIVINYRYNKQLFMSNEAKIYFMDMLNKEELRQHPELQMSSTCSIEYGDYLVGESKKHLNHVISNTPLEVFRKALLKYSNLNLSLWEYAAKSLLNNDYVKAIKLIDTKIQSL